MISLFSGALLTLGFFLLSRLGVFQIFLFIFEYSLWYGAVAELWNVRLGVSGKGVKALVKKLERRTKYSFFYRDQRTTKKCLCSAISMTSFRNTRFQELPPRGNALLWNEGQKVSETRNFFLACEKTEVAKSLRNPILLSFSASYIKTIRSSIRGIMPQAGMPFVLLFARGTIFLKMRGISRF